MAKASRSSKAATQEKSKNALSEVIHLAKANDVDAMVPKFRLFIGVKGESGRDANHGRKKYHSKQARSAFKECAGQLFALRPSMSEKTRKIDPCMQLATDCISWTALGTHENTQMIIGQREQKSNFMCEHPISPLFGRKSQPQPTHSECCKPLHFI